MSKQARTRCRAAFRPLTLFLTALKKLPNRKA